MPTIYDFPDITPAQVSWALEARTRTFESELDGSVQTAELPGERWTMSASFANLHQQDARTLCAFLARLRGRSGRFYITPHDYRGPYGTAQGTGEVSGADQTGDTLVTDGWVPGQAELFVAGDLVQVGIELKMIAETIEADGSGSATLVFTSPLRNSPADNEQIITDKPKCVMMLSDDRQARWATDPDRFYSPTISCVEALDI